ncbi:MAG: NADP-dependent malic enzyme [Bacteroidales bacterium]|nr:NADP-dependent malic enzyme [Bacteroidales bacterium]
MEKINLNLSNLGNVLSLYFNEAEKPKAQTIFLKKLAELSHRYYKGKIMTLPKAPIIGFNWFNVWYTPGVSIVSTTIRDNNDISFELTNRANLVAVVSDSTRVLGDGDCTPPGGLGVMEGKAFLMKYLGGLDAIALCVNNRDANNNPDPQKLIDFVKMLEPSVGAVNLEDISQPNCYKVLDVLREECDIPVWHDDAQGTASITLAGVINAFKLTNRKMNEAKFVLFGAGASNTTIANLIIADGANPDNIIMFDSKGALHKDRKDLQESPENYKKWELCLKTNPKKVTSIEEAFKGADILISLSTPGPNTIKPEWIKLMNKNAIVFACANPIPEIYPYAAKEAGAYIVATGRGDFPNQVNNSLGFPGILKGATLVRSRKITDNMAIAAAHSLANFAEKKGIHPDKIVPTMDEAEVFPIEAADVAIQAIKDGVARINLTWEEAYEKAKKDIFEARNMFHFLIDNNYIPTPPQELIDDALNYTLKAMEKQT